MKWLWYIAQALFIGWWVYQAHIDGQNIGMIFVLAVALCAFITACITQTWDWFVRKFTFPRRPSPAEQSPAVEVLPPAPSHSHSLPSRGFGTLEARSDR